MQGLSVYKASAGSGKTYTLTLEYLKHALCDPYNAKLFRGLLAVTFTNKATEEMKSRILDTLHELVEGVNPTTSALLQHELGIDASDLQRRARLVQTAILHDYSRFSISTIDKFFQKIIHSFVREAGLRPGFKLELDQDRLLEEAIDRLMIGLHEKPLVYDWILRIVDERMESGAAWDVRRTLQEKGCLVFTETFREFGPEFYEKIADNELMSGYVQQLQQIVKDIDRTLKTVADAALAEMRAAGVDVTDFPYGKSSFANYFSKAASGEYEAGKRVTEAVDHLERWTSKSTPPGMRSSIEGLFPSLNGYLIQLLQTYEDNKRPYWTAKVILNNFRLLGLLAEIELQVRAVANIDNLMPISETTFLLGKLIDGSETPFIYERTGSRYHTYMIDEFQDTSAAQWRNFKPLLNNSLAQGQFCMVVGDVKQSIYRWRNGDWRILAYRLQEDFRQFDISQKNLDTNWRSKPVVVEFNNTLFGQLPAYLENAFAQECDNGERTERLISDAYSDAAQQIPGHAVADDGHVSLTAFFSNEEQTANEQILERLPVLITDLQDRGYAAGDIAILVRRAVEGQWVSDCLLEHKRSSGDTAHCFDIVSQDTLFIARSKVVQLAIALLKAMVDPSNDVNNAFINYTLYATNNLRSSQDGAGEPDFDSFASRLSSDVQSFLSGLTQLSLPEVFEYIVSHFQLAASAEELPFIQELHDELIQFARNELSDVSAFLQWWDEKGGNLKLTPAKTPNAINILTIHKSKGLQYPVVLVPFCNWGMKPNPGSFIWVSPQEAPFNELPHVPVMYGTALRDSCFNDDYVQETLQSVVDNTNVLYVAFTRAEEELHVMLPLSKADREKAGGKNLIQNCAKTLHGFLDWNGQEGAIDFGNLKGEKTDDTLFFGRPLLKKQKERIRGNELEMYEYPVNNYRKRLCIRYESEDYFPDTITTPLQYRNYGTLMHRVFAAIHTPADIPTAVDTLIEEGLLDADSRQSLEEKVRTALQNPEAAPWFDGSWQVKAEQFLLLPPALHSSHGVSRRPDRVMIRPDATVVIDYKFGLQQKASYGKQVQTYVNLLASMNYPNVSGYIWYVDGERIEKV